ncbi:MAG: acylphosphatase, partial [Euryarchaeota archaeon]|nr:acylphosphatase [Euryarchaeota archaeon]
MIEKQDVMIEKQDVMIEKQDVMIEKQDVMIEKQDVMIEKQDETVDVIQGLRVDMKSYMDRKFEEIEEDLFMIKSVLKTSGMLN